MEKNQSGVQALEINQFTNRLMIANTTGVLVSSALPASLTASQFSSSITTATSCTENVTDIIWELISMTVIDSFLGYALSVSLEVEIER